VVADRSRAYHDRMPIRSAFLLLLLVATAVSASAQPSKLPLLRIASGPVGQTYRDVYAAGVAAKFPRYRVEHIPTAGSAENLGLLASGKAEVAFAQADVYAQLLNSEDRRYRVIQLVGRISDECVYVARRKDGPVTSLTSLGTPIDGRVPRIAVGPQGGGAHWTWKQLVADHPELAAAETSDTGGNLALNQLEAGLFDAVAWVTDPGNLDHRLLRGVRDKDTLSLLPIEDPSLAKELPSGLPIYQIQEVQIDRGRMNSDMLAPTLSTLCTSAGVFARLDANPKFVDKLSDVVALQRKSLVPKH
jgi:TRAP-type uncharacterized transport system substrate-binding protein